MPANTTPNKTVKTRRSAPYIVNSMEVASLIADRLGPLIEEHIEGMYKTISNRISECFTTDKVKRFSIDNMRIYTSQEVADLLKVTPKTLRAMVLSGRFPNPITKEGTVTTWRWSAAVIEDWIKTVNYQKIPSFKK